MTELELEIQELRRKYAKLYEEKVELARRNRNLLAKNAKLAEKLQTALADAAFYRRRIEVLMDWE